MKEVLQGLVYLGVWIVNLLIYECIAAVLWILIALAMYHCEAISEKTRDDVTRISAIVLFFAVIAAAFLYIFGFMRIVPLPIFN